MEISKIKPTSKPNKEVFIFAVHERKGCTSA